MAGYYAYGAFIGRVFKKIHPVKKRCPGGQALGIEHGLRFTFWLTFLKNPAIMPLGIFLFLPAWQMTHMKYRLIYPEK